MNRNVRSARPLVMTAVVLLVGAWFAKAAGVAAALPRVHVSGSSLLAGQSKLSLRGVNRSGTEYRCIQGYGIFDGPSGEASVRAIAGWHVNFVRIPLNEDCWLGINGVRRAYSGQNYRRTIVKYVKLLHRFGMYAELALMWGAPGKIRATNQPPSPDKDHSPTMWASMAAAFKNDHAVLLAPWGEPVIGQRCLLRGGECGATYGRRHLHYKTAGMQRAVRVMRGAGFRGPIAIPGVRYANDMTHWLAYEPQDGLNQLVAEAHVYGKNQCSSASCFDREMAPVALRVPLIFGETGETYDASSCDSTNTSTFLHWADDHGVGYATWAWDASGNCHALISNYSGVPANAYGTFVRDYYAAKALGLSAPSRS